MLCNRNIKYVLIVLLIAMQYPFQTDFFTSSLPLMQSEWKENKVSNFQISAARHVINYMTLASSIISIFVYYKTKKRRMILSIAFILNAATNLGYLGVNENRFWLAIFLRLFNGVFLGLFHSIIVSYLYHFASNYFGFYGYLIQTVMFLGLVILGILFSCMHWKNVAIVLAAQDILCSLLIWILPEVLPPPKSITHDYIYQKQHHYNLFVIFFLMLMQQFSGIGIVINNVPRMLVGIGLQIESHLQTALMNTIGCFTTFIGAFMSVLIPRRYMWAISSFGLTVGLVIYCLALKLNIANWVGTFSAFIFFMFYGIGQGPITWFLSGELFPDSVRIETGAINIFLNQLLGLTFSYVNEQVENSVGEFGAIIYSSAFDLIAMILGFIFIPAARNKKFENDNLF